jgi:hypothetical protein
VSEQAFKALDEALSRVPELKRQSETLDIEHPLAGSLLWEDRLAEWGGSWPGSFASLKFSVGIDHLFAWQCLWNAPAKWLPVHAHMTLVRSAIECAVQVRWLIDPKEDSTTRIRRALGYRLEDLVEGKKAEDVIAAEAATDPSRAPAAGLTAQEKIDALTAEADKRHMVSIQMLSTVALCERYPQAPGLSDQVIWRYTSGVTHGNPWAALQGPSDVVSAGATMKTSKMNADPKVAAFFTRLAVRHTDQALEDLRQYIEPPR